ncbi:hypothetical protein NKH95_17560 [Mesorhizobium sp. M0848]|uniref:hypothetical protein n=1 Tax=Mesorhizobium sp. M0848 TaxID=2957012 RepID=UPI003335B049
MLSWGLFVRATSCATFLCNVSVHLALAQETNNAGIITEETVHQAIDLLKKTMSCQAPPIVDGPDKILKELSSIGDEYQLGVREKVTDHYAKPGVDVTKLETWESIGEVTESKVQYGASWGLLNTATVEGSRVALRCVDSKPCIGLYDYPEDEYGIGADGSKQHGNQGDNYRDNVTKRESKSSLLLDGICEEQVANVALGMNILIQASKSGLTKPKDLSEPFIVVAPPAIEALTIRDQPRKSDDSVPIGTIPIWSGNLYPTECKKIEGYKFEWCKIHWAGVDGWISKTLLRPTK